jgi:hypothetical protein
MNCEEPGRVGGRSTGCSADAKTHARSLLPGRPSTLSSERAAAVASANDPRRNALGERRDPGRARSSVHPCAFVAWQRRAAHRRTPQRAGASATEGGDERPARRARYPRAPASRTGSNGGTSTRRRPLDPYAKARRPEPAFSSRVSCRKPCGTRGCTHAHLRRPQRCAAHRRTRRKRAPHRDTSGDEHAAVESALSVRAPAPRTVPPANVPHRNARGERRAQGRARASVHPSTLQRREPDRAAGPGGGHSTD